MAYQTQSHWYTRLYLFCFCGIRTYDSILSGTTCTLKVHTTEDMGVPLPLVIASAPVSEHSNEYTVKWDNPNTEGQTIEGYMITLVKVNMTSPSYSS